MEIEVRLKELGLVLPDVSTPGGNYVSVNIRASIAYVAIQFPILNGAFLYTGKLGSEISTEEGYKAMQLAALNVVAQMHKKIGFEKVLGLNHFDAYYCSAGNWDDGPKIVNGASDLFVNLLGEKGRHSRAIFGVADLPRNFCAGITASFTLL